jgi:hypothetical protein
MRSLSEFPSVDVVEIVKTIVARRDENEVTELVAAFGWTLQSCHAVNAGCAVLEFRREEHTRIEDFAGQIANVVRIVRLLVPVKTVIADLLPGYFGLAVREADMSAARIDAKAAQVEVARLVLEGRRSPDRG